MANKNILITGGGTGGHIYPALAIANGIKENYKNPKTWLFKNLKSEISFPRRI